METKEEKGCVYFFKHSGLSPIKIGYSEKISPLDRFNHFKTYAPYGAEIIGFIPSENAIDLEKKLHDKFSQYRLEGEWFDITVEMAEKEIELQTSIEELKLKTLFQIEWAKQIVNKKEIHKRLHSSKFSKYNEILTKKQEFFKFYESNKHMKKNEMAKVFCVSRQTIHKWIIKYNKNEILL